MSEPDLLTLGQKRRQSRIRTRVGLVEELEYGLRLRDNDPRLAAIVQLSAVIDHFGSKPQHGGPALVLPLVDIRNALLDLEYDARPPIFQPLMKAENHPPPTTDKLHSRALFVAAWRYLTDLAGWKSGKALDFVVKNANQLGFHRELEGEATPVNGKQIQNWRDFINRKEPGWEEPIKAFQDMMDIGNNVIDHERAAINMLKRAAVRSPSMIL